MVGTCHILRSSMKSTTLNCLDAEVTIVDNEIGRQRIRVRLNQNNDPVDDVTLKKRMNSIYKYLVDEGFLNHPLYD